jgi:hypothetical protein
MTRPGRDHRPQLPPVVTRSSAAGVPGQARSHDRHALVTHHAASAPTAPRARPPRSPAGVPPQVIDSYPVPTDRAPARAPATTPGAISGPALPPSPERLLAISGASRPPRPVGLWYPRARTERPESSRPQVRVPTSRPRLPDRTVGAAHMNARSRRLRRLQQRRSLLQRQRPWAAALEPARVPAPTAAGPDPAPLPTARVRQCRPPSATS